MDIYKEIRINLLDGEAEKVSELIDKAIKLKYPPECLLQEGLIKGIEILAEKFKTEMVMVPEALIATRALNAGLETLDPYLKDGIKYKARALIGTVEGDIHDIGKNIAKMMAATTGLEVIDLGVDVSAETFVKAIKEYKPEIVMISALLTTTLKYMKDIIETIKKAGFRKDVVIFVGGSPVTPQYAREIGADYYTGDVVELRNVLNNNLDKMIKQNRANKSKIKQTIE